MGFTLPAATVVNLWKRRFSGGTSSNPFVCQRPGIRHERGSQFSKGLDQVVGIADEVAGR